MDVWDAELISGNGNEALREAAAVGNERAVRALAMLPNIDVNSKNVVNGWTAMHWAAYRGHKDVVRVLLSVGAESAPVNSKGQSPADLAKSADVRSLFGIESPSQETATSATTDTSSPHTPNFTPSYLAQPDYLKLWSVPTAAGTRVYPIEQYTPAKPIPRDDPPPDDKQSEGPAASVSTSDINHTQIQTPQPQPAASTPASVGASEPRLPKPVAAPSQTTELIVLHLVGEQYHTVGAIRVRSDDTILDTMRQLASEIDMLPSPAVASPATADATATTTTTTTTTAFGFRLLRHNGMYLVPVNRKQRGLRTLDVYGLDAEGAMEALIVVPEEA